MRGSIGILLINISVALYLAATGIMGFQGGGNIQVAVRAVFSRGDFSNILVIILSIVALAAGVLIIVRLFNANIPIIDLLLLIVAAVWIVLIIMINFVEPINSRGNTNIVQWLVSFSSNLIVLGGIALSTNKFGAK